MLNPVLQGADIAWSVKCRQEDMRQRAINNERRLIDDARRSVDVHAEQLKAVSHLSALIAGFAMVVMVSDPGVRRPGRRRGRAERKIK